jgi:hypothetical protein
MKNLALIPAKVITAVFVLAGACAFSAQAQQRVALVVGDSSYQHAPQLPNTGNDAAAIAAMLQDAGFQVLLKRDIGITDMRRTLREFSDSARNADVAVLYFAGHGVEVNGDNYLVPVDAVLERDIDVDDETISLDRILRVLEPAKSLRLVILDACRDNPFDQTMRRTLVSRAVGRGLAKVEPATTNTLIAFAAKAGSTASDGNGPHSPFTTALLDQLSKPGVDLRIAFGRVRDEVMVKTENKQEPFVYGSLGGSVVTLVPAAVETSSANDPAGSSDQANFEITFWNSIKEEKNPRLFEAYLKRYPNGTFADIARIRLEGLKTASLSPPAARADDTVPISDPVSLTELRDRLYELNFDPGPLDGPITDAASDAIKEFERQNNLPPTGAATMGLLRKLREIGGLKPWATIVYSKSNGKWGMSWDETTRKAAVAHARASCGNADSCPTEVSFFGTDCGVFAYSGTSWAITARGDIAKAKEAALTDCRKRGKACEIVAAVCADGAEKFTAN